MQFSKPVVRYPLYKQQIVERLAEPGISAPAADGKKIRTAVIGAYRSVSPISNLPLLPKCTCRSIGQFGLILLKNPPIRPNGSVSRISSFEGGIL